MNNVTNAGNVLVSSSSILTLSGAYTQSGGITQVDGNLGLTPGQDLKITGGQLVGMGTIGNATSSGTITVINAGGKVRPGDLLSSTGTLLSVPATGTLSINGNYTQMSSGALEIDLAGIGQGTTYDLLTVSNTASLAGTLNVKLLNGFMPTNGEQFDFLTYGALSGGFNSIVALDPGYNYSVSFANGVGTLIAGVPESSTLLSATMIMGIGSLLLRR